MSFQDNLQKTKVNMSAANLVTAVIMFIAYFIINNYVQQIPKDQDIGVKPYWFLIAGGLFVTAGVGIYFFIGHVQKKYKNIN